MDNDHQDDACSGLAGVMWWMTLLVAVLAVPSFGIIVAAAVPFQDIGQVVVFVVACWFCTYLGMKLMENPAMQRKVITTTPKDKG